MAIENGLVMATVSHSRLRPAKNSFRYKVYYLCFPLGKKNELSSPFLSLDRLNLFSFFSKDYGDHSGQLESWVRKLLAQFQLVEADGDIVLMTMPRVFGYAFNPVNFWFCLDKVGSLRAVISETHNTFGEKHSYFLAHADRRPILETDDLVCEKIFHVSPFLEVKGSYSFRFLYSSDRVGVWINYKDESGKLLLTSVVGRREALSTRGLLKSFFCCPLLTFKVVVMIHYQALRLFLKKVRFYKKPKPPVQECSS